MVGFTLDSSFLWIASVSIAVVTLTLLYKSIVLIVDNNQYFINRSPKHLCVPVITLVVYVLFLYATYQQHALNVWLSMPREQFLLMNAMWIVTIISLLCTIHQFYYYLDLDLYGF